MFYCKCCLISLCFNDSLYVFNANDQNQFPEGNIKSDFSSSFRKRANVGMIQQNTEDALSGLRERKERCRETEKTTERKRRGEVEPEERLEKVKKKLEAQIETHPVMSSG